MSLRLSFPGERLGYSGDGMGDGSGRMGRGPKENLSERGGEILLPATTKEVQRVDSGLPSRLECFHPVSELCSGTCVLCSTHHVNA